MATKSKKPVTIAEEQLTADAVELIAIANEMEDESEGDPTAAALRAMAHRNTTLAKLLRDTDGRTRMDPSVRRRKK
jgi:hypothetical protein